MRNRTNLYIVIPALLLLTLALAACEKDRPVPTSEAGTSQPQSGEAPMSTPGADTTRVPLAISTEAGAETSSATPVPLESASATAAKPTKRPAATATLGGGSAGEATTYKIQVGDTLGGIAKQFGVTTDAIIKLNSLTNPDVLPIGQELRIPAQQAASGQASGEVYVVKKGDTLSAIAQRFGVSLADLQKLNKITKPDQITAGQKLQIPASRSPTPTAAHGRTYVVQKGDTLSKIAKRFGVTLADLQEVNNIKDPDQVTVGQVLKIP